jgi:protein TonB
MDLSVPLHLITKYIAMTHQELLQANLLDIVFENRNKSYGAYALRKDYNTRLLTALGAGMSVILIFVFINTFDTTQQSSVVIPTDKQAIIIKEVQLMKEQPKEQAPKQPAVVKVKTVLPKISTVRFTTPPQIKEDNKVKNEIVAISEMDNKQIDNNTSVGENYSGIIKEPAMPAAQAGNGEGGPAEPKQPDFVIQEREPEFPGGTEALKRFLGKNLSTPDQLEAGEKKVVHIKFKVDKDGSVTSFEIVTSGGNEFDREVVRVCKKMPRWTPAIQNGINIPVSYVLPVTFIGMEE